jgi:hypothetical protein
MTAATLILVIIGIYVAFRAGARWRHNKIAWSDTRVAKGKWQAAKKFRWVTLRAAGLAAAVLVLYLAASGALSLHLGRHDGDAVPADVGHTSTPSPHNTTSPVPHRTPQR